MNAAACSRQRELHSAGVPGSSYANVHAYFSGKTQPPVEFLTAAAAALDVRPAWLVLEDGEIDLLRQAALENPFPSSMTVEEREAGEAFVTLFGAIQSLRVTGIAEDVLRNYWHQLCDRRSDLPTEMKDIAALVSRRFPLTVAASIYVDAASADVILFGEAAAAAALDFTAEPREWGSERLEELRSCAPPAPPTKPKKKTGKKKGGR